MTTSRFPSQGPTAPAIGGSAALWISLSVVDGWSGLHAAGPSSDAYYADSPSTFLPDLLALALGGLLFIGTVVLSNGHLGARNLLLAAGCASVPVLAAGRHQTALVAFVLFAAAAVLLALTPDSRRPGPD